MTDAPIVASTLLAYVSASGALGATAIVEAGTVDVEADGSASLEPHESPVAEPLDAHAAQALDLGVEVRSLPPFRVDAEAGEVTGAVGALEHLAEGVRALAVVLGEGSVTLVRFPATDGETPFALAARPGEGLVVAIGDDQYQMDPQWPEST
jgi:hypothetical protein